MPERLATKPRELSDREYSQLIDRIKATVDAVLPAGARVLVVSKGDPRLVEFDRPDGGHFPQSDTGLYMGHYPTDSASAIDHLEDLRKRGAEFLLFPSTSYWWFDHYKEFKRHLDSRYRMVIRQPDCAIFALSKGGLRADDIAGDDVVRDLLPQRARIAVATVPPDESELVVDDEDWHGLADLQAKGVEFLVIMRPAFEWLDRHRDVREELEREHRFVTRQEHVCAIYELLHESTDGAN